MHLLINIGFIVVLIVGTGMTLLGFGGNLLILLAAGAYGYYNQFQYIDYAILTLVLAAYILGEIIEFFAGVLGAKQEKASKRTMVAAFLGTIVGGLWGTGLFPLVGSFFGALFGAYISSRIAEYSKTKDAVRAKKVAAAVVKGQLIGTLVKATIAITMVSILLYNLPWQLTVK